MAGRSRIGAMFAWATLGVVGVGCNLVLGLDGYEDAAVRICSCPGVALAFSDCQARVRTKLAEATDQEREAWLGTYDGRGCGTCDNGVIELSCLQEAPVCRVAGESCVSSYDCCGALSETPTGYCLDGTCAQEAAACKHTFDGCTVDEDCCGSERGLGLCGAFGSPSICVEKCASADGQENCPGCCATLEGMDGTETICIDGPEAALILAPITQGTAVCASGCSLGVDEDCPAGTTCTRLRISEPTEPELYIHYCQ